jgi:hypothetical protein
LVADDGVGTKVRTLTVYEILIAGPSDVSEERTAAVGIVEKWNRDNGSLLGLRLEPLRWETHSRPELGDDAQSILNGQLVNQSDALIAIFGARLGTETPRAASGTAEEIERTAADGKPTMVYFGRGSVSRHADREQLDLVDAFRARLHKKGLTANYADIDDLREQLERHVARLGHDFAGRHAAEVKAVPADPNRKACLNLRGVGFTTKPDRYIQVQPRVYNEGSHEAWNVRAFVADAGSDEWSPTGDLQELRPKTDSVVGFDIRTGPQQDPPVMERFEYRLRLDYRDGLSADNSIEYGIVFEGPGRDWKATVLRDSTVVDPLCPPQQGGATATNSAREPSNHSVRAGDRSPARQEAIDALKLALVEIRRVRRVATDPNTGRQWIALSTDAFRNTAIHLEGGDQETVELLIDAIDRYNPAIEDATMHRGTKDGWWEGIKPLADKVLERANPAEAAVKRRLADLERGL